jgi:DUF4097 and DUF4098 domain-containing protein YvlB
MKKAALAILALGILGISLTAGHRRYDVQEKEEIQRTLKLSGPAGAAEVTVDNVFGRVTVEGYAGSDVILIAHKTILAESPDKVQKAKDEVKLDITGKNSSVDIYVDGPFRCDDRERRRIHFDRDPGYMVKYDFELKVPFRTKLGVRTVNDGDIEIRNVAGDFDVSNVNGEVRMTDVDGSGDAHTVNGEVAVSFKRAPAGRCSFKTINGEVVLGFPGEPSADFRIKTMNGEVYTDFDVTTLPAASAEAGGRKEGRFVYKSNRFFGVRTGNGGPEIKLETLNGDILIKKRSA